MRPAQRRLLAATGTAVFTAGRLAAAAAWMLLGIAAYRRGLPPHGAVAFLTDPYTLTAITLALCGSAGQAFSDWLVAPRRPEPTIPAGWRVEVQRSRGLRGLWTARAWYVAEESIGPQLVYIGRALTGDRARRKVATWVSDDEGVAW